MALLNKRPSAGRNQDQGVSPRQAEVTTQSATCCFARLHCKHLIPIAVESKPCHVAFLFYYHLCTGKFTTDDVMCHDGSALVIMAYWSLGPCTGVWENLIILHGHYTTELRTVTDQSVTIYISDNQISQQ